MITESGLYRSRMQRRAGQGEENGRARRMQVTMARDAVPVRRRMDGAIGA